MSPCVPSIEASSTVRLILDWQLSTPTPSPIPPSHRRESCFGSKSEGSCGPVPPSAIQPSPAYRQNHLGPIHHFFFDNPFAHLPREADVRGRRAFAPGIDSPTESFRQTRVLGNRKSSR